MQGYNSGIRRVSNPLSFTGSDGGGVWEASGFPAGCTHVFRQVYAYINHSILSREDSSATIPFPASIELRFNLVHLGIEN